MKTCKFCNAELNEGSNVCPGCGKENVEAKKLSVGKTVLAVAAAAAVVVMATVVVMNNKPAQTETTPAETVAEAASATIEAVTEAVTEPVTEATVPADGNPDDVTCKGTYTVTDEEVIAARDTVVATCGDRELTVGQLQVFYWMQVRNFVSQYGSYAAYFGLDMQQPLDTQVCGISETPMTWQQYFLDSALNAWCSYSSMAAEADASGYELSDGQRAALESAYDDLTATATEYGFASAEEMIHADMGSAAEFEDYLYFMETYFKANGYFAQEASAIDPTDEEVEAYFDANVDSYAQNGLTKETTTVDVRHILVFPEGADSSTVRTEEFSEEAWAAGEKAAQEILDTWLAGDATEESFAALANEKSQDGGSNTNGGLYEGVVEGQMVQAFNDWCFDPARQTGDSGVVKTEYGFHVMYFVDSQLAWPEYAREDMINEQAIAIADGIAAKNPVTAQYGSIVLGVVG